MRLVISKNKLNLFDSIINTILIIALIFLVIYFTDNNNLVLPKSSMTERELAIAKAKQEGKKTYQYHSSFIPGIGVVDADNIRKQFNSNK
ncbi:hypothetical protein HY844_01980 [Candidatus Berkelbacteria bacterium]|nr:hypothetical protein [Candidatus Berkelbacteria bacterium]